MPNYAGHASSAIGETRRTTRNEPGKRKVARSAVAQPSGQLGKSASRRCISHSLRLPHVGEASLLAATAAH
jgi:hypothetical protein